MGAWPFCKGNPRDHVPQSHGVIGDDIPGGQVIEHLGHTPMTFYSKRAILKEADRRGLQPFVRWAGPHDKHVSNWAGLIDRDQLLRAAALVAQRAKRSQVDTHPDEVPCETAAFSVDTK